MVQCRFTASPSGRAFFWGERWTPSTVGLRELQPKLSDARGVAHAVKRERRVAVLVKFAFD